MRRFIVVLPMLGIMMLGMVLMAASKADEAKKADLMATTEKLKTAYETGDADTIKQTYHPQAVGFFEDGGLPILLQQQVTANMEEIKPLLDAGGKFNLNLKQVDIQVYGDTGVMTAYFNVATTLPNGEIQRQPIYRHSSVWVSIAGEWKLVHMHHSPLTVELPQTLKDLKDF